MTQPPKKLLDRERDAVWLKHYAYSTENTHVGWVKLPFGPDLDNTSFYYEIFPPCVYVRTLMVDRYLLLAGVFQS